MEVFWRLGFTFKLRCDKAKTPSETSEEGRVKGKSSQEVGESRNGQDEFLAAQQSLSDRQGFTDRQDIKLKSLGRYVYFAK